MPLKRPGFWFALLTLAALAVILRLRLVPFEFVWDGRVPLERLTFAPLTFRDVPLNVLLFVPLGLGLAGVLARRTGVRSSVVLFSLALSAALEVAQLIMPSRVPSVADVVANGVGALLGYGLYRAWAMGVGHALRRYVTLQYLLVCLGLYFLIAGLFTVYLYQRVHLDNWDTAFPLVIGNEAVGRRQWSGRVSSLVMTVYDDSAAITTAYSLEGDAPFESVAQDSDSPPVEWREGPTSPQDGNGVNVGPGEWLASSGPFSDFSENARRFNNFSIETQVTTAARDQRGPARIVSISADAEQRNVTLGQAGDALIIRLRTPAAGENGQKPEMLVPGVFAEPQPRSISVRYRAPMLSVQIDGSEEYALSLAPGLAFFPDFATENRYQVVMGDDPHACDRRYYALVAGLPLLVVGVLVVARWLVEKMNSIQMDTDKTDDTD